MDNDTKIRNDLFSMRDLKYRDFHCKLIPTVNPKKVIGVRTPVLRAYSKQIIKTGEAEEFLKLGEHEFYEENNLHAFIIEQIKDYKKCVSEIDRFLPYVDNWATCDSMRPKCFKKHLDELIYDIERWLSAQHTYTVRFGIEMLMTHFLDDKFDEKFLEKVSRITSDDYYINMMIAWYFATALAKQYESTILYIENNRLDSWVHNKTIQKAVESYRISDEKKAYLKKLKR